jgi:hypothetical protein
MFHLKERPIVTEERRSWRYPAHPFNAGRLRAAASACPPPRIAFFFGASQCLLHVHIQEFIEGQTLYCARRDRGGGPYSKTWLRLSGQSLMSFRRSPCCWHMTKTSVVVLQWGNLALRLTGSAVSDSQKKTVWQEWFVNGQQMPTTF